MGVNRFSQSSRFSGSGARIFRSQPQEWQRTTPFTAVEDGLCGSSQYGLGQFQGRLGTEIAAMVTPRRFYPEEGGSGSGSPPRAKFVAAKRIKLQRLADRFYGLASIEELVDDHAFLLEGLVVLEEPPEHGDRLKGSSWIDVS
jgi:hypothetical protein